MVRLSSLPLHNVNQWIFYNTDGVVISLSMAWSRCDDEVHVELGSALQLQAPLQLSPMCVKLSLLRLAALSLNTHWRPLSIALL